MSKIWGPTKKVSGDMVVAAREVVEDVKDKFEPAEMEDEETDQLEEEQWASLPVDPPADYKPALNAHGLPHTSDFQELLKDPEKRYKR